MTPIGGTWNVQGLKYKTYDVLHVLKENDLDWLFITENLLMPGAKLFGDEGWCKYTIYGKKEEVGRGRAHGGMSMMIKPSLQRHADEVGRDKDGNWGVWKIKNMVIGGVYLPPSMPANMYEKSLQEVTARIKEYGAGKEVLSLIVGDFNVKGGVESDKKKMILSKCMEGNGYACQNDYPLHISSAPGTTPCGAIHDLVFIPVNQSRNFMLEYNTDTIQVEPSHWPVLIHGAPKGTKEWKEVQDENPKMAQYFFPNTADKNIKVQRYQEALRTNLKGVLERIQGHSKEDFGSREVSHRQKLVDECNTLTLEAVHNAFNDVYPKRTQPVPRPKEATPKERLEVQERSILRQIRKLKRKSLPKLTPEERHQAANLYKRLIKYREMQSKAKFRKFTEVINASSTTEFVKLISKMRRARSKRASPPISAEVLEKGVEHYQKASMPCHLEAGTSIPVQRESANMDIAEFSQGDPLNVPFNEEILELVTPLKIELIIKGLHNNKAPGVDGVSKELIADPEDPNKSMVHCLSYLFRVVLNTGCIPDIWTKGMVCPIYKGKDDPNEWVNQRPITLLCLFRKIFETCILDQLRLNGFHRYQGGFCPNRSTLDQVAVLHQSLKVMKARGYEGCVLFLDIWGAYDSVDRTILWEKCRERGTDERIIRILARMTDHSSIQVKVNGGISGSRNIMGGVPQGSPISPILYNVYIDSLSEELERAKTGIRLHAMARNDGLLYADDVAIVTPSLRRMQEAVAICERVSRRDLFRWKPSKCEWMTSAARNAQESLTIYGEAIKRVDGFKYLGVPFAMDGIDRKALLQQNLKKATLMTKGIAKEGIHALGFDPVMVGKAYKCFIRPVLEYGLAVCELSPAFLWEVEKAQDCLLLTLLGAHTRSSRTVCRKLLDCNPISPKLLVNQTRWIEKFVTADPSSTLYSLWLYKDVEVPEKEELFIRKLVATNPFAQLMLSLGGRVTKKITTQWYNTIHMEIMKKSEAKKCNSLLSALPKVKYPILSRVKGTITEKRRLIGWLIGIIPGHKPDTKCGICNQRFPSIGVRKHASDCIQASKLVSLPEHGHPLFHNDGITTAIRIAIKKPTLTNWNTAHLALKLMCERCLCRQ
jgi:hypothetical protein